MAGCAYPRRAMPMTALNGTDMDAQAPGDVWRLEIESAQVPPRQRSGLPWDDDGTGPDPMVRIYRAGHELWQSATVHNSTHPTFDATLPHNVWLPSDAPLRIELWDDDGVSADPIGIWQGSGLPENALPNADARILLDSGATLVVRVLPPRAYRGLGVTRYEVHDDALIVLDVVPRSPAGRAGVVAGDRIVAIDGQSIASLGGARAATALATDASRPNAKLTVVHSGDTREQLVLDGGYAWPVM